MTEDNNRSNSTSATSNSVSAPPAATTKKRIEDLLIGDDETSRATFRELGDQEVKSGKSVSSSLRWPLVMFALLMVSVVAVVAGWYWFADILTGQPDTGDQVRVEKRMAAPERPQPQEVAQQSRVDAAREVVTGEKSTATAIAEQAVTDVAEDVTTAETTAVTTAPLSDVAATPAVVPSVAGDHVVETVLIVAEAVVREEQQVAVASATAVAAQPVHRVLVGPFISQRDLERAATLLRERDFEPTQQYGSGIVDMIRLLEGIYPLAQARQRLEELKKEFPSAFLLPDGERWALYIGSFSDRDRARRQQRELAERQIQVVPVDSQLMMEGPLLIVVRSGLKAAEDVAAEVNASGLRARIEIER